MGNKIPEEVIEEIKRSNDIVDIIGEYVQLKRQGRNFFGLCPFHDEKTPSFSVAPDKQIFHCFGCKKGGNVISFLQEVENFSFVQSLEFLAERSGISLPNLPREHGINENNEEADVIGAYDWLTRFYHHFLKFSKEGREALDYFKQRGVHEKTIETFQLGYAPRSGDVTINFLTKKGYDEQFLIKHGLLTVNEQGRINDPFRGRIIFPIRNPVGKTIAFGGRILQEGEPKYINSSDSPLFQKNRLFYNFDLARQAARREQSLILFEGQMDVITAYQAGIENGIATLGTALTDFQARLLNRYVKEVILCYDADEAGQTASYRAATLLRKFNNEVRIVRLPKGYDPDDFIKEKGRESFSELINNSDSYLSFYMHYLQKDYDLNSERDRINYLQKVLKELTTVKSVVEREYYLKDLSEAFNVSLTSLMDELNRYEREQRSVKDKRYPDRYTNTRQSFETGGKLLPAHINAERKLIAYMLQNPFIADKVQLELGADFNLEDHQVLVTHLYGFYEDRDEADVSSFIQWIQDEHMRRIVTELSMIPLSETINDQEIDDYIANIRRHSQQATIDDYIRQQHEAERANDIEKAAQIAMKVIELKRKLNEVKQ